MLIRFFRIKLERGFEQMADVAFNALKKIETEVSPSCLECGDIHIAVIRIARNRLHKGLRKVMKRKPNAKEFNPLKHSVKGILQDDRTRISRRLAKSEEQDLLLGTLRVLPIDLQITLELKFWEHWNATDIAAAFDVTEDEVEQNLENALGRIRDNVLFLCMDQSFAKDIVENLPQWLTSFETSLRGGLIRARLVNRAFVVRKPGQSISLTQKRFHKRHPVFVN